MKQRIWYECQCAFSMCAQLHANYLGFYAKKAPFKMRMTILVAVSSSLALHMMNFKQIL